MLLATAGWLVIAILMGLVFVAARCVEVVLELL